MKYPKVEIIFIGNKFRDIEFTTSLGDELKFDKPRKLYPLRGSNVTESALGTRMLRTNRCAVDNGAREKQAKACQGKPTGRNPSQRSRKKRQSS